MKTEIHKFSQNPALVKCCNDAKFWFRIWQDCDRPKSGPVNSIRLWTKRKFDKQLKAHRTKLKEEYSSRIESDPKLIWKARLSEPAAEKPMIRLAKNIGNSTFPTNSVPPTQIRLIPSQTG